MKALHTILRRLAARPGTALRRGDTSGTALTEFAIIAPCFVLLMFWAEFFTDVGVVKMKIEEASRYMTWEMVAQRDQGTVASEVLARFPDLNSPVSINEPTPSTRSFKQVIVTPTFMPAVNTPLQGYLPQNQLQVQSTGILDVSALIINGLSGFLANTADSLVQRFRFNTQREMQSSVQYDVNNSLFPGGSVLGIFFDTTTHLSGQDAVTHLRFTSKSPLLLVDTWKAWPGPYARNAGSTETQPSQSYSTGGVNAVETEVSTRMQDIAYFHYLPAVRAVLDFIFGLIDMPQPFSTSTWKSHDGPIVILAGSQAKHAWQPQNGTPIQRVGDAYISYTSSGMINNIQSPANSSGKSTDRSRFSVPSNINTGFWSGIGGMNKGPSVNIGIGSIQLQGKNPSVVSTAALLSLTGHLNPYPTMYQCRDGFYMGSTQGTLKRSYQAANNAAFYTASWPACSGVTTGGGGGGGGPWG